MLSRTGTVAENIENLPARASHQNWVDIDMRSVPGRSFEKKYSHEEANMDGVEEVRHASFLLGEQGKPRSR
ncbi:hypothetical protein PAAG_07355 [Paracoccidioides lutzii Pb01]|uniref:Uncharacterized protein n=1 Tax=Paracoccidioides lutzii (strain ATCC MYA-826 / Pb01) TaxID=502779 RepID=C1H9B4_PARBA|nr:hypothetical protein PAAG_07355 [Paracoccidioides lutzii Pb01]EEH36937.2 hypothetical protein PAAG_07355 [Paracoccidioides lutzii Pb01]